MVVLNIVYPFRIKGEFAQGGFSRQFRSPDRIVCRVLGIWVLLFPEYFYWCTSFLNTPNFRFPSSYHLIFTSKKVNPLFVTIWALCFFIEGGRFVSFVQIFVVNWSFWLPTAFPTVYWNSANQSLIYCMLLFLLNTTRKSSHYMP